MGTENQGLFEADKNQPAQILLGRHESGYIA
jgi:hypothetical protein